MIKIQKKNGLNVNNLCNSINISSLIRLPYCQINKVGLSPEDQVQDLAEEVKKLKVEIQDLKKKFYFIG